MNRSPSPSAAAAAATPGSGPRGLFTRAPPSSTDGAGAGSGSAVSAELIWHLTADHDRIAQCVNDVVVRRIFAAGLDLQAALGLLGNDRGASKIYHAIDELDQAIRDIRDIIFDRRPADL